MAAREHICQKDVKEYASGGDARNPQGCGDSEHPTAHRLRWQCSAWQEAGAPASLPSKDPG